MQLPKNLVIILTIALPLSLIMLVARELEAAANYSGKLWMPKVLSDGSPVDANQIDTDNNQENGLEMGLDSTVLDWGHDLLGDVGLYQTAAITADLHITKTGAGSAVAGDTYNYILTVTNHGPDSSSGGTISDDLPAGWSFSSDTSGVCSASNGGFTCTVGTLTAGASQFFNATVNVPVNAQAGTTVTNTATVFGNEDPDPGNDTDRATTTITTSADLSISKKAQPDSVVAGERLTYTLVISNGGPSVATGVVVSDILPSGVSLVSATPSTGNCPFTNPVMCTIGVMDVSDKVTVTIVVDVDPLAPDVLDNWANVSGQQGDGNPDNNVAESQTGVNRLGQLLIFMDDNPDVVAAGTNLAYTILITNSGSSIAANVVMTDTLPPEVDFVSVNSSPGDKCFESLGVIDCSFGNLAANKSASVEILVFVHPSTFFEQIANLAVVSGYTITPSMAVEITDVVPEADLELAKTDSPDPVSAGENLTYILPVKNNGPADAQGVVINDTLPGGVTYQSGSPGCSANGMIVSCDLGTMTVGDIVTTTITVKVNQDTSGPIANTATVLTQSSDPDSSNNTDVASTTVTAKADLAISKSGTPDIVAIGGTVNYTLAIDNNGPSLARDVRVVDNLPPGVTLISATPSQGSCSGTSIINCSLGDLNANSDATVTLVVRFDSVSPGSLENTANVSSLTSDPVDENNSDTASTVVFSPMIRLHLPIFERERAFNNSCETAAPLALNTIYNFLPENRDDWYQFNLPSNGNLVVELSNFVPQEGQLTVYRGQDCSSRTLIGINGSSATRKVLNLRTQPAGHYFIYVSNDAAPSTTPYFLQVIFTP